MFAWVRKFSRYDFVFQDPGTAKREQNPVLLPRSDCRLFSREDLLVKKSSDSVTRSGRRSTSVGARHDLKRPTTLRDDSEKAFANGSLGSRGWLGSSGESHEPRAPRTLTPGGSPCVSHGSTPATPTRKWELLTLGFGVYRLRRTCC